MVGPILGMQLRLLGELACIVSASQEAFHGLTLPRNWGIRKIQFCKLLKDSLEKQEPHLIISLSTVQVYLQEPKRTSENLSMAFKTFTVCSCPDTHTLLPPVVYDTPLHPSFHLLRQQTFCDAPTLSQGIVETRLRCMDHVFCLFVSML